MRLHLDMDISINELSFHAKLGKNIIKKVNKEFNYDKTRTDKFAQLFEDTFVSNLDKETVVDINKNNHLIFSNNIFPDIKYQQSSKIRKPNDIAKTLINECSRTFGEGEANLFELIIIKYINKGKEIRNIKQLANNAITNLKSRECFLDNLKAAERLKKEQPNTKLNKYKLNDMEIKIMQEEAETPGTKLYNLVNKLNKMKFDFSFEP